MGHCTGHPNNDIPDFITLFNNRFSAKKSMNVKIACWSMITYREIVYLARYNEMRLHIWGGGGFDLLSICENFLYPGTIVIVHLINK